MTLLEAEVICRQAQLQADQALWAQSEARAAFWAWSDLVQKQPLSPEMFARHREALAFHTAALDAADRGVAEAREALLSALAVLDKVRV